MFLLGPRLCDADEFGERYRCAAAADVVGQFGGLGDQAAHQQQVLVGAEVDEQPVERRCPLLGDQARPTHRHYQV